MSNHQPRKRFGQHFLHDQQVIRRIVDSVRPVDDAPIVEIGPGLGAITKPLIERFGEIDAIEIDRDAAAQLSASFAQTQLRMHIGDVLKFDFTELANGGKLRFVGNLPYNISTPLLFHLVAHRTCMLDGVFMVQREVAERLCAQPGTKTYGRMTVMIAPFCDVQMLFHVPPGAFQPPPKVDSTVFRMTPWPEAPFELKSVERYRTLATKAFSARRKTLRNALSGLVSAEQIQSAGIDPGIRPDQLAPSDYAKLANLDADHFG